MSTEAISQIATAARITAPVGQGFAERSAGRFNADIYRTQGRQVREAAAYDEARARREARSIIARQTAGAIAGGGADSSAMDVIRENEVNLIADALAIRHRGAIEAAGYDARAAMSEYEGEQALFAGLQGAGAELLTTVAERRARERSLDVARARRRSRGAY